MLMRVRERNDEVEIQFSALGGRQHAVLAAFGSTPDAPAVVDRSKLASLSVRARADGLNVRLRARSGETLDVTELYRALRRALVERARVPLGGVGAA
jgi:uncharacterized protein with GYD domain